MHISKQKTRKEREANLTLSQPIFILWLLERQYLRTSSMLTNDLCLPL